MGAVLVGPAQSVRVSLSLLLLAGSVHYNKFS